MARPGLPLRTLLIGLVSIPLAALAVDVIYDAYDEFTNSTDAAYKLAQRISERAAAQTADFVSSSRLVLAELAKRPLVRAMDPARCDPLLADIKRMQARFSNVVVVDAAGKLVCSVEPLPGGARAGPDPGLYFDEVARKRDLVLGKPNRGFITGRWVSTLAYPVLDDAGNFLGAVGLPIDLVNYQRVVSNPAPPPGGVVAILNGDGALIAHSDQTRAPLIGTVRIDESARFILQRPGGTARLSGFGGVDRFVAHTPVAGSDWTAVAGLDAATVLASARAQILGNLALVLAVFGIVIALTLLLARRIARPLEAVAATAAAVRAGDYARRATPSGARELVDIANEFNAMLDVRARAETELRQSGERFRILAESSPDAILIHQDLRIVFVNQAMVAMMGARSAAELVGRPATSPLPPEFEAAARERIAGLYAGRPQPRVEQVYLRLDGTPIPVEVAAAPILLEGRPAAHVTVRDITERSRQRALAAGQAGIMEMIASGAPLAETLQAIVRFIETEAPEMMASIVLLEDDGVHVRHGAAGRLPPEFCSAIDGEPIGPQAGSCGTAMHRGVPVIVEDIATDPLWERYRAAAAAHGLRACWSTPIFDPQRRVLGSFALYFRQPGRPGERDTRLINLATHTAAIAVVKERAEMERVRLLRELGTSESVFRSVFENAATGMTMTDMQGRLIRCNPAFARMLGYPADELAGRPFAELTHPDDAPENERLYRALVSGEIDHFRLEKRYLRKDGALVWVQLTSSKVALEGGAARFTIGMMEDITARRQAEEELRDSEARYRGILEGMTVGFVAMDRELRFTYANPRASQIVGRPVEALRGKHYLDVFPEAAGTPFEEAYHRVLAEGTAIQAEHYFAPWQRWFEQRVEPTPEGLAIFFRDTTEKKRSESRIEYLATHDGLTGLPNRNLIHDRITQALAHARRAERQIAVMYLDLDRFKVVNDGFGHPFGDVVLKAAGARFAAVVRDDDTVARLSGDEFLILLSDLRKSSDAYLVAQKIVDAFAQPFAIDGREVFVTASVGVSVFPEDGETADTLIGNADVAMYRAKDLGRNTYQFFTADMSADTHRRVQIETELRSAVARGQLRLAYQPKADLATGRIGGCEALLRWDHPSLGAVSPARFIPIAEDSGLIVPVGDWVLRTACAQARAWQDAGLPPMVVSVNLSARQFLQQDVVAWVERTLRETRLAPERLELELTESTIAQNIEQAVATVHSLKQLGVRIAIDDFGTGYSSLAHLKRFRADTLKIDQSFVRHLETEVDDATLVLAVISLAHNLRMTAVAEGVETEAQWRFLRLNRCDAIQGYYFSKPLPAGEFEAMLRSGKTLHNAVSA